MDIVHPAAKSLVDIARSQDSEVGDGTTTVVILAGEFLRECKPYIEEGMHPQTIVKAYREACAVAKKRPTSTPSATRTSRGAVCCHRLLSAQAQSVAVWEAVPKDATPDGTETTASLAPVTDDEQELLPIPEETKPAPLRVVARRRPLKSALATTTVTSTEKKKNPKTVRFSNLEIRTYPLTLGDNPSVSSGPPLTLDWNHETTHTFSIDAYESQLAPPEDRRPLAAMARPASLRVAILCI